MTRMVLAHTENAEIHRNIYWGNTNFTNGCDDMSLLDFAVIHELYPL